MNTMPMPTCDDAAAFRALANNHQVGSHPRLLPIMASVEGSYIQYTSVGGDPFRVTVPVLTPEVENFLRGHYASPPADLSYIDELRGATGHLVCPMCGSMHSGTLDHYLPRNGYPVFSLFSRNLVPACKCNSIRGQTLMGSAPGERILHPYFDDCLGLRLVTAQFDEVGQVPRVGVVLTDDAIRHPKHAAIEFHVQQIVKKTTICRYLADRWSKLCRKPSLVVRALGGDIATLTMLAQVLNTELDTLDQEYESKNNWNSVFVSGLLAQSVTRWIWDRLSTPGRVPDGPLM